MPSFFDVKLSEVAWFGWRGSGYSQRQINVYTSTERLCASHVDVTVTSAYWLP